MVGAVKANGDATAVFSDRVSLAGFTKSAAFATNFLDCEPDLVNKISLQTHCTSF